MDTPGCLQKKYHTVGLNNPAKKKVSIFFGFTPAMGIIVMIQCFENNKMEGAHACKTPWQNGEPQVYRTPEGTPQQHFSLGWPKYTGQPVLEDISRVDQSCHRLNQ